LRFQRRPAAVTGGAKPIGHAHGRRWNKNETRLSRIFADSHGRLLVLGDAGSGKTMALFELAQDLLSMRRSLHNKRQRRLQATLPLSFNNFIPAMSALFLPRNRSSHYSR
jgi:predicted NACHT family NTPase